MSYKTKAEKLAEDRYYRKQAYKNDPKNMSVEKLKDNIFKSYLYILIYVMFLIFVYSIFDITGKILFTVLIVPIMILYI